MNYKKLWRIGLVPVVVMTLFMGACSAVGASDVEAESETTEGVLDAEEMFTYRDKEVGYDSDSAVNITLEGSTASSDGSGVNIDGGTITISAEGTYIFSGSLSTGQIVVDTNEEKVQIVLDNVSITSPSSAAIYVKNAGKVFITLADGSENTLATDGEYIAIDENNIDGVIFSKTDMAMNGTGSLSITSAYGNGIVCKDDLKITSGTYYIEAAGHGIDVNDSVRIADGTFVISASTDGIHAANKEEDKEGYIYISKGSFEITAGSDGMDATYVIQIEGGTFEINAKGGSVYGADSLKADEDVIITGGTFN